LSNATLIASVLTHIQVPHFANEGSFFVGYRTADTDVYLYSTDYIVDQGGSGGSGSECSEGVNDGSFDSGVHRGYYAINDEYLAQTFNSLGDVTINTVDLYVDWNQRWMVSAIVDSYHLYLNGYNLGNADCFFSVDPVRYCLRWNNLNRDIGSNNPLFEFQSTQANNNNHWFHVGLTETGNHRETSNGGIGLDGIYNGDNSNYNLDMVYYYDYNDQSPYYDPDDANDSTRIVIMNCPTTLHQGYTYTWEVDCDLRTIQFPTDIDWALHVGFWKLKNATGVEVDSGEFHHGYNTFDTYIGEEFGVGTWSLRYYWAYRFEILTPYLEDWCNFTVDLEANYVGGEFVETDPIQSEGTWARLHLWGTADKNYYINCVQEGIGANITYVGTGEFDVINSVWINNVPGVHTVSMFDADGVDKNVRCAWDSYRVTPLLGTYIIDVEAVGDALFDGTYNVGDSIRVFGDNGLMTLLTTQHIVFELEGNIIYEYDVSSHESYSVVYQFPYVGQWNIYFGLGDSDGIFPYDDVVFVIDVYEIDDSGTGGDPGGQDPWTSPTEYLGLRIGVWYMMITLIIIFTCCLIPVLVTKVFSPVLSLFFGVGGLALCILLGLVPLFVAYVLIVLVIVYMVFKALRS